MPSSSKKQSNIAIIWDFDKTLTPKDSTSELIKIFLRGEKSIQDFWERVKKISKTKVNPSLEKISRLFCAINSDLEIILKVKA